MKTFRSFFIPVILFFILSALTVVSCIKDSYDLDTLSKQGELNPSVALKIAKGRVDLGDAIEPDDTTVRFNPDQTISLLFREDSLLSFDVNELVEIPASIPESGPETHTFTTGNLAIDDFSTTRNVTLQEIANNLPEPYQSGIIGLDGTSSPFPEISPPEDAGAYTATSFGNYSSVTFASGILSTTLVNNLPVVLEPVTVRLVDANNTEIGTMTFNNVAANGGTQTKQVDLSGLTLVNNEFTAQVTALGTPGSATPVNISLSDNISFQLLAEDVSISAGTAILPDQVFATDSSSIDMGLTGGEEIYKIILKSATISYTVTSNIQEDLGVNFILPTGKVNGDTAKYLEIVSYNGGNPSSGTIELEHVEVDLTSDPLQPFNILPYKYKVEIISSNNMVSFDFTNDLYLAFSVEDIVFEYIEGYLGKMEESFDRDTIKIDDEVLDHISGTFELADPKVQFFYTNSFGVPIELALDATGYFDGGSSVDLGALPQIISYPTDTNNLFITDTLRFDRNNTELENLLVFPPPFEMVYEGSATVNPDEDKGILNFVTDRSRIDIGLEGEIPLAFSASNLTLADTIEIDVGDDFDWSNIAYSKIYIGVDTNWFPLDLVFELTPFNSADQTKGTPLEIELLAAATPNGEGIVETPNHYTTIIDLESEFFSQLSTSDHLIVRVILGTYNEGAEPVKLMNYYSLSFNLGLLTEFSYPFEF